MYKNNSVYDNMSEGELAVCNYVNNLGLWWQYEQPVFVYDEKDRPRVWCPDFFVPQLGIYIEVMGYDKGRYDYRRDIYQRNQISIIFINPRSNGWRDELKSQMFQLHQTRWEFIRKMD